MRVKTILLPATLAIAATVTLSADRTNILMDREIGETGDRQRVALSTLWEAMREAEVDDEFAKDLERVNDSDTAMENPRP